MSFHKELLVEMMETWDEQKVFNYIYQLELKKAENDEWLKDVRAIYRKMKRRNKSKSTPENGPRDGR